MDLYLCISMTNNVESCKKINGRVQTFKLGVFTMGRQELCAENAQKTPKLEKLKRKLFNFYRTQVNLGSDLWVRMSQTNKQTPRGL